jgi:hypothetical protein
VTGKEVLPSISLTRAVQEGTIDVHLGAFASLRQAGFIDINNKHLLDR